MFPHFNGIIIIYNRRTSKVHNRFEINRYFIRKKTFIHDFKEEAIILKLSIPENVSNILLQKSPFTS
jgi:hypothetical protein